MKVQITGIEFDFEMDNEDDVLPVTYQIELTNETIGKVYEIDDEDDLADAISDETGWCIQSLDYVVV
jgi:hypothetical protein